MYCTGRLNERSNTSEAGPGPIFSEIMRNTLFTKSHKIWALSGEPFQNGGYLKLHRIKLTRLGSNRVNSSSYYKKRLIFIYREILDG